MKENEGEKEVRKKGDREREKGGEKERGRGKGRQIGIYIERVGWEIKLLCLCVFRFGTIIIREKQRRAKISLTSNPRLVRFRISS